MSIHVIVVAVMALPAITVFGLKGSGVYTFLISVAVYLSIYPLICTFWCRNNSEGMLVCINNILASSISIAYLMLVLLGAAFGCVVKSIFKS